MLIELLQSLSPSDWHMPTLAKLWTVKDVAAHLLDTNVRAISAMHAYEPPALDKKIDSYNALISFLNDLNATWVNAMKRVSPQLLVELLQQTGQQFTNYLNSLDPFEQAIHPVGWAGEQSSLNWFHIAREYTEKWHHQQQIRNAIGDDQLLAPEFFYPAVDTFMYALPHNYKEVVAAKSTVIEVEVTGNAGGHWYILRSDTGWELHKGKSNFPTTVVTIEPDVAWQMFTKALSPQEVQRQSRIEGDISLAEAFFSTIAVMA